MPINRATATTHLRSFNFATLFIDELGWEHQASRHTETVEVGGAQFALTPIAEKRGIRIFECTTIPERNIRQQIEREITKLAYEHLIIFTDVGKTTQIWQWVAREKGKPTAFREHMWLVRSAPDALIQKLDHIAFALSEEESLTLAGATIRMRDAFDREKLTKKFYEAFKQQHDLFLTFIAGLANVSDRQWYASLMLNRLMFVYFIQKKGFLDGDINYLKNRLLSVRAAKGEDQFHSFYRAFLLRLFHGGLATPKNARDAETVKLLGNIPYLNGGLFEPHALEAEGNTITIADTAFEGVFNFFDQYEWTLDTRPISDANGKEINPDVLGHIFEKYINKKQMGAYYTKEDITDYITKKTVIPWLFQNAIKHDRVAFEAGSAVWRMLSENPDTYIYNAVKHGADLPLPANIAAGLGNVTERLDWNKTAPESHGLPTEIWREVVARRDRYDAMKAKIEAGEITSIEKFITFNLDIRQFARDVIQYAESPDLVRAFWKGISAIKVLDPACGSGAFLFAALGILYDLYDACLERMEQFVESAPASGGTHQLYSDFRTVLEQIERHPNRPYFIYKSIILDNLYGVDIMDEAVEICKLRLFLKLAAQLESAEQIEPLPDIDFNIRAGNTLIGYTSFDEIAKPEQANLAFSDDVKEIENRAQDLDRAFLLFRAQQVQPQSAITADHKSELRRRLEELEARLDHFLALEYDQKNENESCFVAWKSNHKPFHWLIEFFGIMKNGGFDVVVGNPPWKEYSEVRKEYTVKGYHLEHNANLYTLCTERALAISSDGGLTGFIVQLPLATSARMKKARDHIASRCSFAAVSTFDDRPGKLFDGLQHCRSTIFIVKRSRTTEAARLFVSKYLRWPAAMRDLLVDTISYVEASDATVSKGQFPKISSTEHSDILRQIDKHSGLKLSSEVSKQATSHFVFYQEAMQYWAKSTSGLPYYAKNGTRAAPAHGRYIYTVTDNAASATNALLNSSLFYLYFISYSDAFHLNQSLIDQFPVPKGLLSDPTLAALGTDLLAELHACSSHKTISLRSGDKIEYAEFRMSLAKGVLDRIDQHIGEKYRLNASQIDLVTNYDVRFRMGADEDDAE